MKIPSHIEKAVADLEENLMQAVDLRAKIDKSLISTRDERDKAKYETDRNNLTNLIEKWQTELFELRSKVSSLEASSTLDQANLGEVDKKIQSLKADIQINTQAYFKNSTITGNTFNFSK